MTLSKEKLELIEKIGIFHTERGMTPAAARIEALLLVSDKLELTFDEIREILVLSKSATSNAINSLLKTKTIYYSTKTGDRKRYFRSSVESWRNSFTDSFEFLMDFHKLLTEVKEIRTKETKEFNKSLEELTDFIAFCIEEFKSIIKKWEDQQTKK